MLPKHQHVGLRKPRLLGHCRELAVKTPHKKNVILVVARSATQRHSPIGELQLTALLRLQVRAEILREGSRKMQPSLLCRGGTEQSLKSRTRTVRRIIPHIERSNALYTPL